MKTHVNKKNNKPQRLQMRLLLFLWLPISALAIDWSYVPSTPPQARNLENSALGSCPCDLVSGHCDVECCCDPDCTSDVIKLFDGCLPEPTFRDSRSCVDSSPAVEIFRINHADVRRDERIPAENAVCVVRNNYPKKIDFFSVPSTPVTGSGKAQPPLDWFGGAVVGAGFRAGDPIPVYALNSDNNAGIVVYGNLGLFARGNAGYCSSPTSARYMYDAHSSCVLDPRLSVAEVCSGFFQSWYRAALRPNSPITSMAVVAPIVVEVRDVSGALLKVIDPTAAFESAVNGGNVTLAATDISVQIAEVCTNVPIGTHTKILLKADGTSFGFISSVNQTLIVSNVSKRDIQVGVVLEQSVEFVSSPSAETLRRSGNPGFVRGYKVPAGILLKNGTQEAVQEAARGFALPLGDCMSGSWNNVRFLYDVRNSQCVVYLNESELQDLCASGTQELLYSVWNRTLTASSNSLDFVLAQTGDADWRVPSSWIPVNGFQFSQTPPSPYSPIDRQCSGIVVGMAFEIFVGRAGSVLNPQDIIIGVRADPIYGAWSFKLSPSEKQGFAFRTTVKWVRKQQEDEQLISRRIIPPPILPSVHENVFFPFRRP